ncbi:MAG TPA: EVE domain-containing protein [Thermoanaerobaculaceae bacterium]|nr:EVE domain-containing protein [Thermoanaerobaculaceae bacterium]
MARWLLKTEPSDYSWADLIRDRRTVWDGVTSAPGLKNIRSVAAGDEAIVYHTGEERAAVGLARITSAAYADPAAGDPRLVVFDLAPVRPLARPVTLAQIKADPAFAGFDLVRVPRLSVVPVSDAHWRRIVALAGA